MGRNVRSFFNKIWVCITDKDKNGEINFHGLIAISIEATPDKSM